MQARFTLAVLLGVVLLAAGACSSGGDDERIAELETDLEASEEALERETEARETAEEEAEQAREEAQEAEEEAEQAQDDAAEAERQRQAAEQAEQEAEEARQEAEEARQEAEAERARLAAAAEERRKADAAERARTAISGHEGGTPPGTLMVGSIKHGAPAPVTEPAGPFTTTTGRSGSWSTTSLTANAEPTRDTIEIYSDVEAPKRSAFSTSPLNTGTDVGGPGDTPPPAVIDGTEKVVGWVNIMNADGGDDGHSRIAAAGAFPRVIGDSEPFKLVDKGLDKLTYTNLGLDPEVTDEQLADVATHGITRQQYNQYKADRGFRDPDEFPDRYAYTTSGSLQGAGGRYRCSGASPTATCTVQNNGGSFTFGPADAWAFIPSSGTVQIVVPDAEYMWFGVWARQTVRLDDPTPDQPTEKWAFEANHGGTNRVSDLSAATGSATYQGPAAGRYAVYEPDTGDSSIGSFTASATLQADFDATPDNTVSGMITGFSNDPGWSLALKRGTITGGTVARTDDDDVTWTIDGVPDDSGEWGATFYTNLNVPESTDTTRAITYQPHGIAGTFEAAYDPSGVGARAAVIGAFGAHR